jgi:hypothetical protein
MWIDTYGCRCSSSPVDDTRISVSEDSASISFNAPEMSQGWSPRLSRTFPYPPVSRRLKAIFALRLEGSGSPSSCLQRGGCYEPAYPRKGRRQCLLQGSRSSAFLSFPFQDLGIQAVYRMSSRCTKSHTLKLFHYIGS